MTTEENGQNLSTSALCPSPQPRPIPYGLMSLWDMINWHFKDVYSGLQLLRRYIDLAQGAEPSALVSRLDLPGAEGALDVAERGAKRLNLLPVLNWIFRARYELGQGRLTNADLAAEFTTIVRSMEDETGREHFFHYARDKAELYMKATHDWGAAINKFPASEQDILEGVDCYASEHFTAAVFHLMRVCERGLRALVSERKAWHGDRPLDRADWNNLLQALSEHVKQEEQAITQTRRQEYAEFYKGALSSLDSLKHWWRHPISHARLTCKEPDSRGALEIVREFMIRVASKTDENGKMIDWS